MKKTLPILLLGGVALFALGDKKEKSQVLDQGQFSSGVQYRIKEKKGVSPNIFIEMNFKKWVSLKDNGNLILLTSPGEALDLINKIGDGQIVVEEATGNLTDISNL